MAELRGIWGGRKKQKKETEKDKSKKKSLLEGRSWKAGKLILDMEN